MTPGRAPRIAFYISGHGFGHASREVEIINALGPALPTRGYDPSILIRSAVSPWLLSRTITVPHELQPFTTDTGIAQLNSVQHDDASTIRETMAFYAAFDARVDAETAAMAGTNLGLIVGDIPPLAFAVANQIGIPSIAIGNFLWDWIYEGFPELATGASDVVPIIRRAYARATLGLRLPFSHDFSVMPHVRDIPLVARHATRGAAETRAHFGLPCDRPVALLSFGGYGLPALDMSALDCLREWSIVVTDRSLDSGRVPAQVHQIRETAFIDSGMRYEDLVAAVDVVVTKPGYGIVAECIAGDTAILYTSRGQFREYDVFVEQMPRYSRCRFISQSDLFAGRWRDPLDELLRQPPPAAVIATNGAGVATAAILDVISR